MKNKEIAVQLILHDLKHAQLIGGLRSLRLTAEEHESDLLEFVLLFMGVSPASGRVFPEIKDDMNEIYGSFLDRAAHFPVSGSGEELRPLAEQCYGKITDCMRWNDRINGLSEN